MRRWNLYTVILLLAFLLGINIVLPANAQDISNVLSTKPLDAEISTKMGQVEIPFIKNEGQIKDDKVKYYVQTFAGMVLVEEEGLVYLLPTGQSQYLHVMVEKFSHGEAKLITGQVPATVKVNYYKGDNISNWKQNIPTYDVVSLGEVYENIEVNLKAYGDNVEKIFVVSPGGDPNQIAIELDGIVALNIGDAGHLVIETGNGTITMTAPIAYQEIEGKKEFVEVAYWVSGNSYGFNVGEYDPNYDLVIDPMLASSIFGGNAKDNLTAMVVDDAGNVYVTGYTNSLDMVDKAKRGFTRGNNFEWDPWSYEDPNPSTAESPQDVFVAKLDPNITSLLAATYIGGSGNDRANAMTLGKDGSIYIAGTSKSSGIRTYRDYIQYDEYEYYDPWDYYDVVTFEIEPPIAFPTTVGAYQTRFLRTDENTDYIDPKYSSFFVTKLDTNLNLVVSTLLGEGIENNDGINGIVIDTAGNVYVAGKTSSDEYTTTSGAYDETYNDERGNAFVSKLDGNLANLLASTYLGGGGGKYEGTAYALDGTWANDIAVDTSGNVYVTGETTDKNFPIVGGYQDQFNRTGSGTSKDAFVAKFNTNLTDLLASTYLGGGSDDVGIALALDESNVFVTGNTTSNDFPVTEGAYQETRTANNFYYDIFVTKLNGNLDQLLGGTYLGGDSREDVFGIALDDSNIYLTGSSDSSNYPVTDSSKGKVVISKLNKDLTTLIASTLIGDNGSSQSIVVKGGKAYIAGNTDGSYPVTDGTYNKTGRNGDVFITILEDTLTHARITEVTTDYGKYHNKSFGLGAEIVIQVKFNANVIVEGEGKPKLKLNASEEAVAIYHQGSGTSTLEFLYIVQPGDSADILNYLDRDSLVLEDCAILDMGLGAAELKLPDPNSSYALSYRKIKVNTLAPTVVKVSSPIADGTYGNGYDIPIEATFTEKVKVEGTPYLILNTEPERVATYASGSGTNTLTFIYNVGQEDSSIRLNYKDTNSLKLSEAGSIKDSVENVADLTLPDVDSENSLAGQKNIVIDNNAPYIVNVTSSLEDGSYGAGQVVPIEITFSEPVNVTNTPRLALNIIPERYADYKSGTGTEVLTFEYIVKNGDNTLQADTPIKLNYSGEDALILRFGDITGTITGVAKGNNAILTLPDPNSSNSLGGNKNVFIDTNPPKYKSLTIDEKTSTTYGTGTTLHINLTYSEVVFVEGTPFLELNTNPARNATYLSGSGTDTLKFVYTIMEGDSVADNKELDYKGQDALRLGEAASIKDAVGHDADLTLAWSSSWISTGGDLKKRAIKIDTVKPFWETNSTLEATNITENSLKLTWSKTATDNVKIDAYNIYQDDVLIGTVKGTAFTAPTNTYNVTGLSPGNEYTFRVEALDAAGNESNGGPVITVITEGSMEEEDTQAPVWQTDSLLEASEVGIHHVILKWKNGDVTDNVAVTGFNIYQDGNLRASVDANTTSYKVTELTSFTGYSFAIQAIDMAGNESENGPTLEVTTKLPDLIIQGNKLTKELEFSMNDLINLESDEKFPPESEKTPIIRQKYSAVNNYGTRKNYAAEGVRISYLLKEAGVESGYGKIAFYSVDGGQVVLSEAQINEDRFYFPAMGDPIRVEPILAFQSTESTQGEPNFGNMIMHYSRLFFGQKAVNEITNNYFLGDIYRIVIGDTTSDVDEDAPTWSEGSNLQISEITETSIILSWPPAQDNVGVTAYRIYQDGNLIATVSSLTTFCKITDLLPNVEFTFKVEAGDAAGNWSSDGPSIIVTTKDKPPVKDTEPPTWESGILKVSNITSTGLTLTWAGANDNVVVTHYNIYQDDELITTVDGALDSYSVTNLNPYTEYTFKVEAGDAAGNLSNNGPSIVVSTLSIPPAKISLNLSKTSGTVGEIITASGKGEPNHWVVIRVIENKEDIVVFDTIKSDDKGNYTCTFKIPNVSPGKLIVIVGYEKEVAIANLTVRETSTGGGGGNDGGGTPSESPKTETPPRTVQTISQEVNPSVGATITLNNEIKIVIPPNALNETKPIEARIEKAETVPAAPSDAKLVSEVYEFSIGNQNSYTFARSIIITLPFDLSSIAPDEEPTIFYYNENQQEWIKLGGEVSGNTITVRVDHFTKFAVFGVKKVSMPVITTPQVLSDISGHWAKDNIMQLITANAVSGYPDGNFRPDNSITRAEFVTILVKAFNMKGNNSKVFSDTSNHWAKDYISIAADLGIVSGYNAEQFRADELITREQMAVMVVKAAKLPLASEELSFIDQATIASWAKDYVATAVQNDIIKGYPDNSVKPQGYATRAEAVTVIVNVLK